MPKLRQVVTVATTRMINNFDVLGAGVGLADGTLVRFHNNPVINIDGDIVITNFDLFISDDSEDARRLAKMLTPEQVICLPRYDKMTQTILMLRYHNDYAEKNKEKGPTGFKPLLTHFVGPNPSRNFPTYPIEAVIKPQEGARGIGHFVIDLAWVNFQQFMALLGPFIVERREVRDPSERKSVDEFLAPWNGHVSYHPGRENYDNEGLEALTDQGYLLQELVSGVKSEWRVITDYDGYPTYCQRRVINQPESALPQATGAGEVMDHSCVVDWKSAFPNDAQRECFRAMCKNVIGPLNSIDLFITKDDRWGIFEYCNQFGVAGIPSTEAHGIHLEFITRAVKHYLNS